MWAPEKKKPAGAGWGYWFGSSRFVGRDIPVPVAIRAAFLFPFASRVHAAAVFNKACAIAFLACGEVVIAHTVLHEKSPLGGWLE
jgi:hypothetical protein